MLHFQYVFTEIKTKTSSLILFLELARKKKFLKDDRNASHKDILFIAVEKEWQVFLPPSAKWKNLVFFDIVFCDFKCTF